MTPDLREFLAGRPWVAKIATVRSNGRPYVQPIWFDVDADDLMFVVSAHTVAGRCIRREGRATVCVDDTVVPYAYAVIEGPVAISDDQDLAAEWMERLIRRYRDDVTDPPGHTRLLLGYGVYVARLSPEAVFFEPIVSPPPTTAKES